HVSKAHSGEPSRCCCKSPGILFDEQSCSSYCSSCAGRLAEHFGAAGSWTLRAVLQRTLRALGTPLAEPLLWLHAWPNALVVSLGLRGTQSGTSRHGRASGGIPVVECGRAPGRG